MRPAIDNRLGFGIYYHIYVHSAYVALELRTPATQVVAAEPSLPSPHTYSTMSKNDSPSTAGENLGVLSAFGLN